MPLLSARESRRKLLGLGLKVDSWVVEVVWEVGGVGGVRAGAQPYLGPRPGVYPGRRHDG